MLRLIPVTVPELRRMLLALAEPPERFHFRMAWSFWRRHHQAIAKACHVARRARRPVLRLLVPPPTLPAPQILDPVLSEAQWQRVLPLLPPQRPPRGRPNRDHRQMVAAMFWAERTGCSWRTLPSRFGPWQTIYCRYQQWCNEGRWAHILQALDQPEEVAA